MCTKFNASQTEIADLFQVERKKFFTSITGCKYDPGKKPTKSEKLKTSPKKDTSTEKQTEEPQPSQSTTSEVDPEMPPPEDIRPKQKLRFKIRFRPLTQNTFQITFIPYFYSIKMPTTQILFFKT